MTVSIWDWKCKNTKTGDDFDEIKNHWETLQFLSEVYNKTKNLSINVSMEMIT
jgi:hypothetical protein